MGDFGIPPEGVIENGRRISVVRDRLIGIGVGEAIDSLPVGLILHLGQVGATHLDELASRPFSIPGIRRFSGISVHYIGLLSVGRRACSRNHARDPNRPASKPATVNSASNFSQRSA
jgi:hypothetical protein